MRTLISTPFVSLDGKLDPTGGDPELHSTRWTFKTVEFLPEAYEIKGREQEEAGALLFGRSSYQLFAPVWPGMADFATYKGMPKYVVSTTLTEADLVDDWGENTILRSLDEVAELKKTEGGPILVHGSATLTVALQEAGLIDRYHLLVFPVLLGAGKPLFSDADLPATRLKLIEHEVYPNGVQKQIYDVLR
ncbi:dihydrofolate reductase family protein [Amycolatopsis acidicola]|uniref:Dihydrofolate reductase family protein n=1 Tax=Amycolatopsis acidicola TaxID=2596893 RepID=A0A5N0UHM4_9PSEU|nr:dihydrofolate reductase family protein [Amycolatopsis acidicola]KAA9147891.1 dihydrofolate reductase family protein [Amycolatopsis acidicola]